MNNSTYRTTASAGAEDEYGDGDGDGDRNGNREDAGDDVDSSFDLTVHIPEAFRKTRAEKVKDAGNVLSKL